MRRIQLSLDSLKVESFDTASIEIATGFFAPTRDGGPNCGSAIDLCPSARGCTVIRCV